MTIIFIINSRVRGVKRLIQKITHEFDGYHNTIALTHYAKHAVKIAQEAVLNEFEFLISVGGDGTLNECLNGMMSTSVPNNKLPILGMLQCGSANDFSKSLGLKNNLSELKEMIAHHTQPKIDIGKIKLDSEPDRIHYFINIAGLGLGPEVVKLMDRKNQVLGSLFSYVKAILQSFMNYEKKQVRCVGDNWEWSGGLLQLAIGNGKYFGDSICVCPDAEIDDGLFHVSLFGDLSIRDYLKNFIRLRKGEKIIHPDAHYHTSKEIRIDVTGGDACGIEGDGEYKGTAPATITVIPKAIHFLCMKK